MRSETLKFQYGKFFLENVSSEKLRAKLSRDAYWTKIGHDFFTTTSLKAAAAFRSVSDSRTEKIFKRAFQEHYGPDKLPPLTRFRNFLDPHQIDGVTWVLGRKRSYLAHAPGAGKTAQAIIAACLAHGPGQTLFIVPPSLTLNWEREILKFTRWMNVWPSVGIVRTSREQDQLRVAWGADFVIVPDSMMLKPWVYGRLMGTRWKFIAVDEASRFKECDTARSLAFYGGSDYGREFPGIFKDARHVVFLDGSPMPNRPIELWAPTYALHPEAIDCMSRDDFGYRYCGATPNEYGQWEYKYSSHEDELKQKLQKDFMHVVTEGELSHPERRRSMMFMDEDVRSTEQKSWEKRNLSGISFSDIDEDMSNGKLAAFRRLLGVKKVPWVSHYVQNRMWSGKNESILLFAWHRDVIDGLESMLIHEKPGVIKGGVPASTRDRLFQEFQAGKRKLLILQIAAAGRGINLQRADRAVFAEWSWSDEQNKQCEKRTSRRGNSKLFVRCDYIVCPGSMDEPILSSVFTKQKRVKEVIG